MISIRRRAWRCGVGWLAVASAGFAVLAGCSSDDDYYDCDDYYCYGYYPYASDYYYSADLAYSDAYYAGYNDIYPGDVLKGTPPRGLPGDVLRRLASGDNFCGGQATVTTTGGAVPCEDGTTTSLPIGKTISLNACELPAGGELTGSIQIDVERTLSDASCGPGTSIDVNFSSMTSDLSYTAADGSRVVVPELTRTGTFSRVLRARPSALSVTLDGRIEHYDAGGAQVVSHAAQGAQTLTFLAAGAGYSLDGVLTIQDALTGDSATVTGTGVTRVADCCHPTGGTIRVDRSEGEDATWSFGPACGEVTRNGTPVQLRDCL